MCFDVTGLVHDWVNGYRDNDGFLLIAGGNTVEMSFWSTEYSTHHLRPKLVVEYIAGGAATPTATSEVSPTTGPSPTPTETSTPGPGGTEMILQDGYLGYAGTEDTSINQWYPDTNQGGSVTMAVRQGDIRSALVRFDLSPLPPGATIHEAKLELWSASRSNPGGLPVSVFPVLRPWAEGQATWVLATAGVPWGLPGCNLIGVDRGDVATDSQLVTTVDDVYQWDVTTMVQGWVAAPGTNHGMMLREVSGMTSVEYHFATSEYWWGDNHRPKLIIYYST